jgi:hypothetical protein
MRILLDSRDLINVVEHERPINARDLDSYLRAGGHQIVLSFTNVRELAGPLASGAEFLRVRPFLQSLALMPHTYLKEVAIVAMEIQSAVDAFNGGAEYAGCSPYVTRWDRTLMEPPGRQRSAADDWVNLRLDEIIYLINRARPDVFAPPDRHLPALQTLLEQDRASLRAGQAPARHHFARSIKNHATTRGVPLPPGREDEFAEWVYQNPHRCPGLRLSHETYRALMVNYTDVPETSDFSDLAHIAAVPYVDAATLDRRMRHYCGAASRKMLKFGATHNYADRLREDVAALMAGHSGHAG